MRETSRPSSESGFSLLELIVAVAITMVVTGAVYGLMSGGNSAFRREPELTDRQQNARAAMDMIQRDIGTAGTNMGPFFQSFTRNLNGVGRVTGPAGQVADHLEIFGNDGTCPDAPAAGIKGSNFTAKAAIPSCYSEEALVLVVFSNGGAKWGLGHNIHAKDFMLNFPPGQQPTGSEIIGPDELKSYVPNDKTACAAIGKPEGCSGLPVALSPLNVIRYEIANDPPGVPEPNGVPSLYRSATGGRDPVSGTYYEPTSAGNVTLGRWQLLARGVEDLQVQYRNGDPAGAWNDDPGAVICTGSCVVPTAAEYQRGVREVRVTMSVRASGYNLQGQTTGAGSGPRRNNAVRGNITSVTSVKALLSYLAEAPRTAQCPECPIWR